MNFKITQFPDGFRLNLVVRNPRALVQKVLLQTRNSKTIRHIFFCLLARTKQMTWLCNGEVLKVIFNLILSHKQVLEFFCEKSCGPSTSWNGLMHHPSEIPTQKHLPPPHSHLSKTKITGSENNKLEVLLT